MAPASSSSLAPGAQSMLNFTTGGARFPRREMQAFDPLVTRDPREPGTASGEEDDEESDGTHTDLEKAGFLEQSEAGVVAGASTKAILSTSNSRSTAQVGGGAVGAQRPQLTRRLQWPVAGLVAILVVLAVLSRGSRPDGVEAGSSVQKAEGLISLADGEKSGSKSTKASQSKSIGDAETMYEEAASAVASFQDIAGIAGEKRSESSGKGGEGEDDDAAALAVAEAVVETDAKSEGAVGDDDKDEEDEDEDKEEEEDKTEDSKDSEKAEEEKEEDDDSEAKPFSIDGCSASGESCLDTKCCKEAGEFCFYKTKYWGRCLTECKPGVHLDEPAEWQQPWTCEMPVPRGQKPYPKLFCYMALRSSGMELKVGRKQAELRAGVFACDAYTVFSDDTVELAPKIHTKLLKHFAAPLSVPGALTATWVNTQAFIEAWDTIIKSADPWNCDWMVKVDPDTVFFPPRAKALLRDMAPAVKEADTGAGVYIQNCDDPHLRFYGSMELLSHKALGAFKNRNETCDVLEAKKMGEDMWMERCFALLGVKPVQGYQLLHDQYCPAGTKEEKYCDLKAAGFHPYKAPEQWQQCHDWAMPKEDK